MYTSPDRVVPPVHTTDDPSDPRLTGGPDTEPRPQAEVYLVLSDDERAKGFVRPLWTTYTHLTCGSLTSMSAASDVTETFARDPHFYGVTYCVECQMHLPVGEFVWPDGSRVGS